ncbi:conserved hypothetical protein [Verrucomicrobia bacterium]|nr:conserved hypothetical protein [Verrucomicrobiota bacterium]
MRLAVLSDTHNFLDPKIPELFVGAELILHAGDIGLPRIVHELEQIAPVIAVFGNTDEPGLGFRETEVVEFCGRKFLVHHIVNPHALGERLEARIARERPDAVVFGHTHKPFCETLSGILFFNPGYAGKSRFGMKRSVAVLDCDHEGIRSQYFTL